MYLCSKKRNYHNPRGRGMNNVRLESSNFSDDSRAQRQRERNLLIPGAREAASKQEGDTSSSSSRKQRDWGPAERTSRIRLAWLRGILEARPRAW